MKKMDSIKISEKLTDLQGIGVRAGICCGLENPEIVTALARECAKDYTCVTQIDLASQGIEPPKLP